MDLDEQIDRSDRVDTRVGHLFVALAAAAVLFDAGCWMVAPALGLMVAGLLIAVLAVLAFVEVE